MRLKFITIRQIFNGIWGIKRARNFPTFCGSNIIRKFSTEEETDDLDKPNIRNILYKNSEDNLIQKLNESASVQDVFNIIRQNYMKINYEQISQAVLVLWDLQKIFYRHNIYYKNETDELVNTILKKYIIQVNNHKDFELLLELIGENYMKFSLDALSCTLLYLNRMGVEINNKVMQLMIERCEAEIKMCNQGFPLTALSRFIVTIHQDSLISNDAQSIVNNRLEKCSTEDDFKLLTICLFRMKQQLTPEVLQTYKNIAVKLIDDKKLQNTRTVLKSLRFLTYVKWFELNIQTTNKLMHLLKNNLSQLNNRELLTVYKIFQMQKEPADMLEELQQHALYQISLEEEEGNNSQINYDLLSCVVMFSSPSEKPRFENLLTGAINNLNEATSGALYKILYHIKSDDPELCRKFWDKSLKLIQKHEDMEKFLSLSLKYIHFTIDIGQRHINFENEMLQIFMENLENPQYFCRIAMFIIAFNNDSSLDEKILDRLNSKTDLNTIDVLNISKGIQSCQENKKKIDVNRIQKLNTTLNLKTSQLIETQKLNEINILLRSYVMRKCPPDHELFTKMLNCFRGQSHLINSNIVKDLSYYLQINNYLHSDLIDVLTKYVIENSEKILGSTVEKVLYLCYTLGYIPQEDFLEIASRLIIRDQELFTGLTFLQSALALCFFQKLPDMLINKIFSVDFLEQLDLELSNCYAKTIYPSRVRDHMMQLNRAVCLDYPEMNVPWFHGKYTEQSRKILGLDYFHKQVLATLQEILMDVEVNTYSAYGYHIDFEFKTQSLKTAILLLKSNCYCMNAKNLKGYFQMRQRHLEILGYNVININYDEWKKFYVQEDCVEYIKNKLSSTN